MTVQEQILAIEAKIQANKAHDAERTKPEPVDKPAEEAEIAEQPETPAEQAAPAKTQDELDEEEDADEDSADSDGDPTAALKPKRKQSARLQRRINRIEREKYEALRERDALAIERQYLLQQMQQGQPQNPQQPNAPAMQGEPTLEQFGYDQEAFQKAERQWLITEAKRAARQEIEQEFTQRQIHEQGTRFNQRVAELEKKMPGAWQRATQAPLQTTPVMEQVIFHSEVGPEVGVYLAEHLDEAQAITRLPPMQQAVAMGRIEAAVKAPQTPAVPKPVTVSRAPAPAPQLPTGTAQSGVKDWSKATMADHIAAVEAQRKAKFAR